MPEIKNIRYLKEQSKLITDKVLISPVFAGDFCFLLAMFAFLPVFFILFSTDDFYLRTENFSV